jgi:hypothetical protein
VLTTNAALLSIARASDRSSVVGASTCRGGAVCGEEHPLLSTSTAIRQSDARHGTRSLCPLDVTTRSLRGRASHAHPGVPQCLPESDWDRRVLLTLETRMMEHGNYWCAAEAAEVSGRAA